MPPVLLPIFEGLAVVLAALLLFALRGRRVNDHPICRRCGYDLFGLAAPKACPECGRTLARRRAVRRGQRRPRRWIVATAGPLLVLDLIGLGATGWLLARQTDFNRHKPVWWLRHDTASRDAKSKRAAIAELLRRLRAKELSTLEVASIADRALSQQADMQLPWEKTWETFLEVAQLRGLLTSAQLDRYAAQAVHFTLVARPVVGRNDPLPIAVGWWPSRRGTYFGQCHYAATFFVDGTEVGRITTDDRDPEAELYQPLTIGSGSLSGLAIGRHSVRAVIHLSLRYDRLRPPPLWQRYPRRPRAKPGPPPTRPALGARRIDFDIPVSAEWKLVPAVEVTVKTDPARRAEENSALHLNGVRSSWNDGVAVDLLAERPPVGMAFEVFVRGNGFEWDVGPMVAPAGERSRVSVSAVLSHFSCRTVDVVLRPRPEATKMNVAMQSEAWGEEIAFRAVPVQYHGFTKR